MFEYDNTKECSRCYGYGREGYSIVGYLYHSGFVALPHFKTCPICKGLGVVDMTDEEIAFEDECRRIDGGLTKFI